MYDREVKAKRQYKVFSTLISTCLGLQIIVAAALTALGAANGSHSAVTVFGAINTVIAGFLTYLKGSGLPNRMKYYQHEWAKVREYIEQRERDLSYTHDYIDVHEEVNIIRRMYEEVRADVENNIPDRFVSTGHLRNQPIMTNPGPPLAHFRSYNGNGIMGQEIAKQTMDARGRLEGKGREMGDFEKELESQGQKWFHEKESQVNAAVNRAQGIGSHLAQDLRGFKRNLGGRIEEVSQLEHGAESRGKEEMANASTHAKDMISSIEDARNDLQDASRRGTASVEETTRRGAIENQPDAAGLSPEPERTTETTRGISLKEADEPHIAEERH